MIAMIIKLKFMVIMVVMGCEAHRGRRDAAVMVCFCYAGGLEAEVCPVSSFLSSVQFSGVRSSM